MHVILIHSYSHANLDILVSICVHICLSIYLLYLLYPLKTKKSVVYNRFVVSGANKHCFKSFKNVNGFKKFIKIFKRDKILKKRKSSEKYTILRIFKTLKGLKIKNLKILIILRV